jgi:hypothetical protein
VQNVRVGDFVVGSFVISDNSCEICRAGFQSKCVHAEFVAGTIGTQAELARIPHADGTLVVTPGQPDPELIPALLAASDVLGTGWFAAVAAEAGPGKTVAVVGDGAVGLMAVLAAKQLGAERIIAMSGHADRQADPARQPAGDDVPPDLDALKQAYSVLATRPAALGMTPRGRTPNIRSAQGPVECRCPSVFAPDQAACGSGSCVPDRSGSSPCHLHGAQSPSQGPPERPVYGPLSARNPDRNRLRRLRRASLIVRAGGDYRLGVAAAPKRTGLIS